MITVAIQPVKGEGCPEVFLWRDGSLSKAQTELWVRAAARWLLRCSHETPLTPQHPTSPRKHSVPSHDSVSAHQIKQVWKLQISLARSVTQRDNYSHEQLDVQGKS